jgi:hypothetical protein
VNKHIDDYARKALAQLTAPGLANPYINSSPCGCIGPQNGEPCCPCAMRSVTVKDGRYVRVTDLGPAPVAPGGANENAQGQMKKNPPAAGRGEGDSHG